jgi:AmmeMemoRadiSam system protein A
MTISLDPQARHGERLVRLAREALEERLRERLRSPDDGREEEWLQGPGATFVTLRRQGELRGCIGNVEPRSPLIEVVRANAVGAALRDPRFPPVRPEELDDLEVEVTLLSEPEPLPAASEEEAIAALRPGVDGVLLRWHHYQSTYLPQVWESVSDPRLFLASLRTKAGLPADLWDEALELHRYVAHHWREGDLVATPSADPTRAARADRDR